MRAVADLLRQGRAPRVIGFDDAPFSRQPGSPVHIAGVVCAGTRMEGMLWGQATRDGWDATEVITAMLRDSKFHAQVHLVLLDGLAIGGFNVIDLPALAAALDRPCVAVMRRAPNMAAIARALTRLEGGDARMATFARGGPIHQRGAHVFQCEGLEPEDAGAALAALTDQGHVPEALRLAHLIGAAIKTGQSSSRA